MRHLFRELDPPSRTSSWLRRRLTEISRPFLRANRQKKNVGSMGGSGLMRPSSKPRHRRVFVSPFGHGSNSLTVPCAVISGPCFGAFSKNMRYRPRGGMCGTLVGFFSLSAGTPLAVSDSRAPGGKLNTAGGANPPPRNLDLTAEAHRGRSGSSGNKDNCGRGGHVHLLSHRSAGENAIVFAVLVDEVENWSTVPVIPGRGDREESIQCMFESSLRFDWFRAVLADVFRTRRVPRGMPLFYVFERAATSGGVVFHDTRPSWNSDEWRTECGDSKARRKDERTQRCGLENK